MNRSYCVRESELRSWIDSQDLPLECCKSEWKRQTLECFSDNPSLLTERAQQVLRLRQVPEQVETALDLLKQLRESETILREHTTSDTSKTADEQIFFTGEHTKPFNHIPYLLTLLVFFKVWLAPALALFTPLILFVMPYVILKTLMNMDMPWDVYMKMMKHMMFGIQEGQPWSMKQWTQVAWTAASLGQGMVMPFFTAYHTQKLDATLVRRGHAIQALCSTGHKLRSILESVGADTHLHLKMPEAPSDPREAVAWMEQEPLVQRIVFKLLGQMGCLVWMASDSNWRPVLWTSTSSPLHLENICDIQVPSKRAVASSLELQGHSLLTGPNRGGKSSSLRAILQQVLLGQIFGMTYSAFGSWAPFSCVLTRLNSKDTAGKESLFEMEVRLASQMLKTSQKGFHSLVLIDELFHSTNPPDAETSATLFLSQLWSIPTTKSMVSTHIFRLCDTPGHEGIQTFCCPAEEGSEGRLTYSYSLQPGVCRVSSVREVLREAGLCE